MKVPLKIGLEGYAKRKKLVYKPNEKLEFDHVLSLWPFWSFGDFKLNHLAFNKRLIAIFLNCRIVDEHVAATWLFDESIALAVIKPFHFCLLYTSKPVFNA